MGGLLLEGDPPDAACQARKSSGTGSRATSGRRGRDQSGIDPIAEESVVDTLLSNKVSEASLLLNAV